MTLTATLLRAPHIGIRDFKARISEKLKGRLPLIVTDHGQPKQVMIAYKDIVEIAEILDELRDPQLVGAVKLSRKASKEGSEGIPVAGVFSKIRASRK